MATSTAVIAALIIHAPRQLRSRRAIVAQPQSPARRNALAQALMATYVRDHIAIDRICGPILHPETATPT
jgi:hypothetical protein